VGDGALQAKRFKLRDGDRIGPRIERLPGQMFVLDMNYEDGDKVPIIQETCMIKVSRDQVTERDGLVADLRAKGDQLANAIKQFNTVAAPLIAAVEDALDGYNERLEASREFISNIAETMRSEFDERSERWQDSETGKAADLFIKIWEDIDLEDVDIEVPLLLEEIDGAEHAVALELLPETPETE
jgi:hypothetical protein